MDDDLILSNMGNLIIQCILFSKDTVYVGIECNQRFIIIYIFEERFTVLTKIGLKLKAHVFILSLRVTFL